MVKLNITKRRAIIQRGVIEHEQIINIIRVTRVAGVSCHSVGVAAAEELGLEVKQVCWLSGFEVIST